MHENELTTQPIGTLIKNLALPASLGFFFNTMFNVVDTFYAGQISTAALAALSISFPVFFIIIALGSGLGTGATSLIANSLGAQKTDEAKIYAAQTITFSVALSIIASILGLLASPALFRLLGAEESYLSLSLSYMNMIFYGTVFFILVYGFNASLNAQGNTKSFRNVLIVGFFANVLLDPWFMYGWIGFPRLGITGVALATIAIEAASALYLGIKVFRTPLFNKQSFRHFFPERFYIKNIAYQGVPAALNMMTIGVGIFIITYFVSAFGKVPVAAYGIATRIEQIFLLPTIGLTIATLTLVAQNNGAAKFARVREALNLALKYGLFIMTIGTVLIFLSAYPLMNLFTKDVSVINAGVIYLRIAAFITWAYALLFICISALQGLERPLYAIWIGLFRQILAPVVVFWFLSNILGWGIFGIWLGIFIITWAAALVTVQYTKRVMTRPV